VFDKIRQEEPEMKKAIFILVAIVVTLVAACQTDETQNKNKNANGNTNVNANANQSITTAGTKDVWIYIYDDGTTGNFTIDDPGAVTLHKLLFQKIRWCVQYTGKTPPTEVVVDNFISLTGAHDPFETGTMDPNSFHIPASDFGTCAMTPKPIKATAVTTTYKYNVTVNVTGVGHGHLDPQVIIND
jgi:hypothetical protein